MALKRGLGKGLDSLIPTNVMMESEVKHATVSTASSAEEGKDGTLMVKLSKVEPNREQPRKNFDEDSLQELAESLKQFGMLQPILVQNRGDYYEIIAGERRWRAAKIAGLKEVPVIVRELTDQEIVEISLIENIHPGAGEGPKGPAVRRLKRHASWVQNVARQFGPLSSVGVGKLRGSDLSTRGPGLTHHWCIGCTVKCMAE